MVSYKGIVLCLTVEVCDNIPSSPLLTLNTTLRTYGTYLMGTCPVGYHFEGGPHSRTVTCLVGQVWSDNFTQCICE